MMGPPTRDRRAAHVSLRLESVLTQTYRDFEILVSDNAASLEVEALVSSYRDARRWYVATLHDDDM
jgi:hypothetical protein